MTVDVKIPSVGESITEVYIGQWRKQPGDPVEQDEPVVELESEKATFDAPAPAAGTLDEILKQAGDRAEVGEVIARIRTAEDGDGARPPARSKARREPERKQQGPPPKATRKRETRAPAEAPDRREPERNPSRKESETRVMPAAARLLAEHDLAPEEVQATGPGGRLLKEDVLRHVEQQPAEQPPQKSEVERPGVEQVREQARRATEGRREDRREAAEPAAADREEDIVPLSPIRRRIAERLVQAQQQAALLTTFNEIDLTAVKALRSRHQSAFQEKYGVKLGFMSFFVKAAVDGLAAVPQVNAEIRGQEIVYRNYYDIGIAIGGGKGLVVPVLRSAERLSFAEIEQAIDDFARRAQSGDLRPDELRGGTFTITNGGIYGSLLSTPIVNPPQSGVLGMHAIQDRPVVRDGQVVARPMMYVALTYDHRLIDGREAVTFLRRIKEVIEEPARLLLEV
jgi:2-oxoglutarate dehydrogenase E2 component (dihydrolipoamide succinyltransferase)